MAGIETPTPWAITNARVFTGAALSSPRSVFITNGLVADHAAPGAIVYDAAGASLLPGFIDTHVHLDSLANLTAFAHAGVTTALDMGTHPLALVDSLRGHDRLTDIRSAGSPATGPGSLQTTTGGFAPSTAVTGPDDAERFIADRVREGSDYVKIIIENPADAGPGALSTATIAALVIAAHKSGLLTIAQVTSTAAFQMGLDAWVDVLTHTPLNAPLTAQTITEMQAKGISSSPTLTMMKGTAGITGLPTSADGAGFHNTRDSVTALNSAGITIVAGTDANSAPTGPFSPPHGESLHDELELLVQSGLTPTGALRSATVLAASLFGLSDRGAISTGLRADLVLVDGDPTADITAIRNIRQVWINGMTVR